MYFRWILMLLFLFITLPVSASNWIGPINTPTQAKEDAWTSIHEAKADEDYFYEDDRMIVWFDVSSGGFPRGLWLKEDGKVLRSRNSTGQEVVINMFFGGGYQLIANLSNRPDSPYENFMIFFENHPRPGLSGRLYVREETQYTDIGFIGQLNNMAVKSSPGFDPNRDEITPEHTETNPYIAQSWPTDQERWVHVATDPVTRKLSFEKIRGDGSLKRVSYRVQFRIYHGKAKFDTRTDVFLYNKPPLDVILMCMDTFNEESPDATDYIKSLGATGLDTASFDASEYDNWLGIPAAENLQHKIPAGKISTVKHVQKPDHSGNGATSFVIFKRNIRSPWIEITNGSRDKSGKVSKGLNVTVRRDFSYFDDCSHFGFTDTPWFNGPKLEFWWVSNEVAFLRPERKDDLEIKTLKETVSFRLGR